MVTALVPAAVFTLTWVGPEARRGAMAMILPSDSTVVLKAARLPKRTSESLVKSVPRMYTDVRVPEAE